MSETRNCSKFHEFKPTGCKNKRLLVVTECVYRSFLDLFIDKSGSSVENLRALPFRNAPGAPA